MNQPKFRDRLIMKLLAQLHQRDPKTCSRVLRRAGFRAGDVTFRLTNGGRTWTEINRWPWDPR